MDRRSDTDFLALLRDTVARGYHDRHPFHLAMHEGKLTRDELRAWVVNRYYYQTRIPIKDALVLAKSEDPAFRRAWIRRIHAQDGVPEADFERSGLAQWERLGLAVGADLETLRTHREVLPAVRFASDAYVQFVREKPLLECVASTLTEFLSPDLLRKRLAAWLAHYPWVSKSDLAYFETRPKVAERDAEEAVRFVTENAHDRDAQDRCVEALRFKCDVLWALLDALVVDRKARDVRPESPA